jgi:YD repeat-containing protein
VAVRRLYGHPRRTAYRNFRTPANRCSSSNLVTVIEPDPTANPVKSPQNPPQAYPVTSVPAGYLLTSYTYDQLNHLTQVSMPRSTGTQTRTFAYTSTSYPNKLNLPALWLTSATNPENGTVSYTYNADGTLATKTDANNNIETYSYDTYQRLIAIPDRGQTFTYDTCPANDTFCTSNAGQLVEATFGSGVGPNSLSFQYDYTYTPAGKVAGKSLTLQSANNRSEGGVEASGTLTASYTYDKPGRPDVHGLPDGRELGDQPDPDVHLYAGRHGTAHRIGAKLPDQLHLGFRCHL